MPESSPISVIVYGAGSHAKVTVSTLQAAGWDVRAVFDDNPEKVGQELLGVPIVETANLAHFRQNSSAIIAIGDNAIRRKIAGRLELNWGTAVHPRAYVHPSVRLGHGTVVFAGAVIQPDAQIGNHVIINTGATVDHECVIEDYVHIAPGVHLAGNVHVEEGALIGIGAVSIQRIRIGRWSVVGAGAVVIRDLPEQVLAVGVPAEIKKKLAVSSQQ